MVTEVPTDPLAGAKLVIVGLTRKVCVLVRVVDPVVTVTDPVTAAAGTVALMKVLPMTEMAVACTPPNFTTEAMLCFPEYTLLPMVTEGVAGFTACAGQADCHQYQSRRAQCPLSYIVS